MTILLNQAANQIGKKGIRLMVRKSTSRLAGLMRRDRGNWKKAFRHISEHFKSVPKSIKGTHGVFARKYRNETEIKKLLQQVAKGASRAPIVGLEKIGGKAIGRPVVLLQKRFKHEIGTSDGKPAHILVVVMDYTGRLLTAYPVTKYLTAVGVMSAATIITTINEAYASEKQAVDSWYDSGCSPNHFVDWLLDFVVAPSCVARDRMSRPLVENRADLAIQVIEKKIRQKVDRETRGSIRQDILSMWGY